MLRRRAIFARAPEGPLSRAQVKSALASLRHKELILRTESSAFAGATEYTFKHELLRSVTYETLLRKARLLAEEADALGTVPDAMKSK